MAALAVLVFGSFVGVLNQTLMTPTFPAIMAEYSVATSTVQWLTTGFTLVNAIMIPITAYLTDRFPIRSLFIFAMSVFTAGTLLAAIAPAFWVLLAGRLFQAAGAGILFPMVATVMMTTFPIERRGQVMGVYGLIVGVAPAIGPTLGGIVVDHGSWHDLFFIVAALSIIVIVLGIVLAEKKPAVNSGLSLDKLSVVESTIGFGSLLYGFSNLSSGNLLVCGIAIAVGLTVTIVFFRRQKTIPEPMLNVGILKERRFFLSIIIGMVVQMSLLSFGIILPIYLESMRGYSATVTGLVFLPATIVMAIMSPISGTLFDRHGARRISVWGTAILAVTTCAFALLGSTTGVVIITVVYAVRLFGMSLVNMPIFTWGINSLDNRLVNHGNAMSNTLRQVAGSFGGALLVVIMEVTTSWASSSMDELSANILGVDMAFATSGLLCVIACILTIIFVRDKDKDVVVPVKSHDSSSVLDSLMKHDAYTVSDGATVLDAMKMMVEKKVSGMPIVDDAGKLVGFISDGDILRFLSNRTGHYPDPIMMIDRIAHDEVHFDDKLDSLMRMSVTDVGRRGAIAVNVQSNLSEVCRVLSSSHLKKMPVVDDEGRLVGVVNRSNIIHFAMESYLERADGDKG